MRKIVFSVAVLFVLAVFPVGVQATTIASDSFDYVSGALGGNGSSADPGWSGSWDGNVSVLDGGSLSYTDTKGNQLVTAGNRVQTAPGTVFSYRNLEVPLLTSANYIYMSFLMDNYSNVGIMWSGISFYHDNTELFFMGKPGNSENVGVHVPGRSPIVSSDSLTGPLFFVICLQLVNNGEDAQAIFWLNPDLDGNGPNINSFVAFTNWSDPTVNRIRIAGETGVVFDELRIGTTYSDVSPFVPPTTVPEPTTVLLMGLGLLSLVGYSRKRFSKKS